jgi:hypothetical protein
MANATVVCISTANNRNVTTDSSGYYLINELPAGTYQVMVTSLNQGSAVGIGMLGAITDMPSASVEVTEGQMTRHDFGAGDGTTIEGTCTPGPGMIPGRASGYSNTIGPSGQFSIEGVPPGEWQLHIFYLETGGAGGAPIMPRYVYTQMVTVAGEDIIPIDVFVGN